MPSYPTHFQAMCVFDIDLSLFFLDTFILNITIDRDNTLSLCLFGYLHVHLTILVCAYVCM